MLLLIIGLISFLAYSNACTNYLVTPGASVDGSSMVSYSADSGSLYGTVGFYPRKNHSKGATRECYRWDTGEYMGVIPEADETYQVIANSNEFQLTIGETTFGGLSKFATQPKAVLDYGCLIWITLQRAKTAREAIKVMDELMQNYGYGSGGESFSIADPNEVWIMEVIGKGPNELGSVWVAQKIPDGFVSGHANQARIQTFDHNDPENALYAKDLFTFTIKQGLFDSKRPIEEFSFSDIYDPVSFGGARFCEIRVWNLFHQVSTDESFGTKYLDYVSGTNLTNRMPLWIKPKQKLSLNQTLWFARSHFENTVFDMSIDDASGPYNSAYRARPLTWKSGDGVTYHNERTPGTQQTGWHFVAQQRSYLPRELGIVVWFGMDDTSHSVHVPFYPSQSSVAESWADHGIQHVDDERAGQAVNFDSAWWVTNMVANFVYNRYDVAHPFVEEILIKREAKIFQATATMESVVGRLLENRETRDEGIRMLTTFSNKVASDVVTDWLELWKTLFFRFRDFFITTKSEPSGKNFPWPNVVQGGYSTQWNDVIVKLTGDKYKVPDDFTASNKQKDKLLQNKI